MDSQDRLLGIREVMALLSINRRLPYQWNQTGQLKAVELPGGALRWRKSDIDAVMAGKPGGVTVTNEVKR